MIGRSAAAQGRSRTVLAEYARSSAVLAAIAGGLLLAPGCGDATPALPPSSALGSGGLKRGLVETPSGKRFDVEVVADPRSREHGLKSRSSVLPGTGMLFVFPAPGRHRFWMYECLTSLDILWLDAGRRVVHIEERLQACPGPPERCPGYGPSSEALYVLELGPGVASASKIHTGDRLTLLFSEPPNPT